MNKRIFIDLDQTLIHSYPSYEHTALQKFGEKSLYEKGETYHDGYVTYVRPLAREFVDYCHDMVGIDNVYILTAAKGDYARDVIVRGDLKIPAKKIHDRDSISYMSKEFHDGYNILVDDLPYYDNYSKLRYLAITNKLEQYINIVEYTPYEGLRYIKNDWMKKHMDEWNYVKEKIAELIK